ncbi:uncharacterized protein EV420DRAFT_522170 [Desarmillaria tabescens]|uniref:Uncharacterized protein n=1 Tax=Armillaria tabescens TaxID=1929756 RepID=A0AA39KEJ1_ARMTA|nr:uncharacterized protein EV420DRAFT_522170 [Desarmillaria tabescens]KAK0457348.1 hypothetical protein EV420DRAFT_522170 [Desarmillaria tabescens]
MSDEQVLIAQLNQALLGVFGHGIHTCVVIVALCATFLSKQRRLKKRHIMVSLIMCLYIFATIYVASDWVYTIYYSIGKGKENSGFVPNLYHSSAVGLGINTGIADGITIWRCWIIWGRRWSFVIPPILLFLAGGVCGCFAFQRGLDDVGTAPGTSLEIFWMTVFLSFSLGTTLWCTTLIIYRILTVKKYTDDRMGTYVYCRIIEILVESASLHAIGLIGCMVLLNLNAVTSFYPLSLYITITAISPTLIVARVASGNARPDDSWQASNGASSLRFGSAAHSTSMNPDSELSADIDLEHDGSETTDSCEPEGDVDIEKGADAPENRRTEAASDL